MPRNADARGGSADASAAFVDVREGTTTVVFETTDALLEAPNWHPGGSALVVNGEGRLWRLELTRPRLVPIEITGVPPINNDHVVHPDGSTVVVSADDGHLYRVPVEGGAAARISRDGRTDGFMHFLHGISPDGARLAFVGLRLDAGALLAPVVMTMSTDGDDYFQVTADGVPADGPEYDPRGEWLYLNTEQFDGHAQIARVRRGRERPRAAHPLEHG